MRVLLTTDAVGGVWTYAMALARGMVEVGDDCMLAVVGALSETQRAEIPAGVEWRAADHRLEWDRAAAVDIRAATGWLEDLASQWRPDVVHLNQFAYGVGRFPAPTVMVAHSDVWSWFGEVRHDAPGDEWATYRQWVGAGLRAADLVVAPTRYQSALLARHYGRGADHVIHNGMVAPHRERAVRASGRPFILAAGRAWDEAKGFAVLDEALERLGDRAPSAHLAGALEGPGGERFRPRRLHAHGRVPHEAMARLYENAGVYVATSRYEPFGLAPLEAALHGCALVLSDIGSFHELWDGAAEFFPVDDPQGLAGTLTSLLADRGRLDALGAAARSRALERYGADQMVAGYRALYGRLMSPANGPPDVRRSA